ncbi:MAG: hypothetical protein R3F56_08080 [Planctomycetota bacterium]
MALVLGVMFTIIAVGLVVSGTLSLRAHRTKTETSFRMHGQSMQFARAGLIEALGWFRKQTSQPVMAFDPRLDTLATPPVLDTQEPDIGIVREFQISGLVWGRYEVWKQWDSDPNPTRLAWRRQVQCEDISAQRGSAAAGNVWLVRSVAYVFQRPDDTKAYNVAPNRVLGSSILETELRRLTLVPPGMAAVCCGTAAGSAVRDKTNIQGAGGAAVYYRRNGTTTFTVSGGAVTQGGVTRNTSTQIYDDSVTAVFGVTEDELRSLADDRITNPADFPQPVPRQTLCFVDVPNLDVTASRRLEGNAIVYVRGNVNFQTGNQSFFTGFLYVNGNLSMSESLEFNGTIICTGTVNIQGVADWINITYDDSALNSLRTEIGQYRLSGAIRGLQRED